MKLKSIIGILLILLSIAGMYFWETKYRKEMIFTKVLAAAADIHEGDIATEDSFKEISVSPESLVSGYLTSEDKDMLLGKECVFPIKENGQIFYGSFEEAKTKEDDGMFDLVLPGEWIYLKDLGLDKGVPALIYYVPSGEYIGRYEVRSVKAGEYVEIRCPLDDYLSMVSSASGGSCSLLLISDKGVWAVSYLFSARGAAAERARPRCL